MKGKGRLEIGWIAVAIVSLLAVSCGGAPTPTVPPSNTPAATTAMVAQPTQAPKMATSVPATPTTAAPTVGGVLRYALPAEFDTLDPQKSASGIALDQLGGSLITKDYATGKYVPYLADSWQVSSDGLTWEFKLKKGVQFHDGSSFTAKDWVYTFTRAKDPATKSPVTAALLQKATSFEASDDYTLVVTLSSPMALMLDSFADGRFLTPVSKAAVEQWGDQYGRHPVSVGPFKFKEWITGQKVVLERNPDFSWGPSNSRGGPTYIQTLEYVVIPEAATQIAGLEAGELDYALVQQKDLQAVQSSGTFATFDWLYQGVYPAVEMNTQKAPFDDLRVRQAFSLALDRQALIKVAAVGDVPIQYGPVSASTSGYWSGVEKIGYGYDLAKAQDLMKQAGYTPGADGMLQKDGKPIQVTMQVGGFIDEWVRVAQALKEQYKALGVEVKLAVQGDAAVFRAAVMSEEFEIGMVNHAYPNAGILSVIFNSKMIGVMNVPRVNDPELDRSGEAMVAAVDWDAFLTAAAAMQKRIVEQAYLISLYTPKTTYVVSGRVQGARQGAYQGMIELYDAYIVSK